jgi:protein-tyrosine phosphatase
MVINLLHRIGWLKIPPTRHLDGKVIACRWPSEDVLRAQQQAGAVGVINLTEQPHDPTLLARVGLPELHLAVHDFQPPSAAQVEAARAYLQQASGPVIVHCRGGFGRTGTLIACLYVAQGLSADDAVARTRHERPGTIETRGQLDAVRRAAQSAELRVKS